MQEKVASPSLSAPPHTPPVDDGPSASARKRAPERALADLDGRRSFACTGRLVSAPRDARLSAKRDADPCDVRAAADGHQHPLARAPRLQAAVPSGIRRSEGQA